MSKSRGSDKRSCIINMIISAVLVVSIMTGIYFVMFREKELEKEEISISMDSEILSTDPKVSTANFIAANGTMGDIEKDLTEDKVVTNESLVGNKRRRLKALEIVEESLIPGSPLISGREESKSTSFADSAIFPYLYRVENIEVSEPVDIGKLTVFSDNGPSEYESVELYTTFDSIKTTLTFPTDVSYSGIHSIVENVDTIEDLKVTLVKSGDIWFVYDIEDAEKRLNERFATWEGIGKQNIDVTNDEIIGEIDISSKLRD